MLATSTAAHSALTSTLLSLLRHRAAPAAAKSFDQIHALLLTSGIGSDFVVASQIAQLLAFSTAPTATAYKVVKQIHRFHPRHPVPFLFNSLVSGYARSDSPCRALLVYKHAVGDGFSSVKHTFPLLFKSCARFSGIWEARQLQSAAFKLSFSRDLFVQNALVYAYAMCGEYDDAGLLFDEMSVRDVVSWTGLISGHVKGGFFGKALELFASMDVEPNTATLVSVLIACGRLGKLSMGMGVHGLLIKREGELGLVSCNALLDMYMKCECLVEARRIFDEIPHKDIVSWTSIISGFVQCKHPKYALEAFHEMQALGLDPDKVTLSSVLSACASLGALDSGRWIHEYIERKGIDWDVHIGTAMVDMYAKCGCLEAAVRTFHEIPHKNVSSWNALLGALSMHGHGEQALEYFDRMVRIGINPNEVTFVAILSACSHCGLVKEGRRHFESMHKLFNIEPSIEHYGCMVDLFGRAGLIDEAHELVIAMPMRADLQIWGALLSACKAYGRMELSHQIKKRFIAMSPSDSGVYVLLSNIYAENDQWVDVKNVRKLMRDKGIKKETGSSVIEVNGVAYEFHIGEHEQQVEAIWQILYSLAKQVQVDCL